MALFAILGSMQNYIAFLRFAERLIVASLQKVATVVMK